MLLRKWCIHILKIFLSHQTRQEVFTGNKCITQGCLENACYPTDRQETLEVLFSASGIPERPPTTTTTAVRPAQMQHPVQTTDPEGIASRHLHPPETQKLDLPKIITIFRFTEIDSDRLDNIMCDIFYSEKCKIQLG